MKVEFEIPSHHFYDKDGQTPLPPSIAYRRIYEVFETEIGEALFGLQKAATQAVAGKLTLLGYAMEHLEFHYSKAVALRVMFRPILEGMAEAFRRETGDSSIDYDDSLWDSAFSEASDTLSEIREWEQEKIRECQKNT